MVLLKVLITATLQHFSGGFSNDSFEFAFLEETILN
jgi:hypothetical protein